MIVLTDRLSLIADNIPRGDRVADIGTDHGYLPLYLIENNLSTKVILTDISKGSLSKAIENGNRLFPDLHIDYRIGDGLEPLDKGEVDTVVMAGIGGLLTIDILDWDISKALSFKRFIFQPRNNSGMLRRYLLEQGFTIEKNLVVPENKRYSEIIVATPPTDYQGRYSVDSIQNIEFDFPESLGEKVTGFEVEYLKNAIQIEKSIMEKIIANQESEDSSSAQNSIAFRKGRIARLQALLNKHIT